VGIGTHSPDTSAILELNSHSQGFLMPRMTESQRLAIFQPADGLLVYQLDGTRGFYYYTGTTWLLLNESAGWLQSGNAGTNPAVNLLGTTDSAGLAIGTNNIPRLQIDANGPVRLPYYGAGKFAHKWVMQRNPFGSIPGHDFGSTLLFRGPDISGNSLMDYGMIRGFYSDTNYGFVNQALPPRAGLKFYSQLFGGSGIVENMSMEGGYNLFKRPVIIWNDVPGDNAFQVHNSTTNGPGLDVKVQDTASNNYIMRLSTGPRDSNYFDAMVVNSNGSIGLGGYPWYGSHSLTIHNPQINFTHLQVDSTNYGMYNPDILTVDNGGSVKRRAASFYQVQNNLLLGEGLFWQNGNQLSSLWHTVPGGISTYAYQGNVGIGKNPGSYRLDVGGDVNIDSGRHIFMGTIPLLTCNANGNYFVGHNNYGFTGANNSIFGFEAGLWSGNDQSNNTLIGAYAGQSMQHSNSNVGLGLGSLRNGWGDSLVIAIGPQSGVGISYDTAVTLLGANTFASSGITHATAIGADVSVYQKNSIVLGRGSQLDKVGVGISTPEASLHVDGDLALASPFDFPLDSQMNDINIGRASHIRVSGDNTGGAGGVITGFAGNHPDGKLLVLINTVQADVTINHQDASSQFNNQIITNTAGPVLIHNYGSATFMFDGGMQKWVLISLMD